MRESQARERLAREACERLAELKELQVDGIVTHNEFVAKIRTILSVALPADAFFLLQGLLDDGFITRDVFEAQRDILYNDPAVRYLRAVGHVFP